MYNGENKVNEGLQKHDINSLRSSIVHYQRRKRANSNFSLEFIFSDVRKRLSGRHNISLVEAPCLSNGVFRRIWIIFDAWLRQGLVTHITGDITFAALLLNRKTAIVTILDCGILKRKRGINAWLIKKFWFEIPLRRARFITTISNSAATDLKNECNFDTQKLRVIPVAISERFQFTPQTELNSIPRLLQIGTAPNKNLTRLFAAIDGLEVELSIIGKLSPLDVANLTSRNIRYRNRLNLAENEIVEEYRRADLVCFPSLYEGFGMPILEAQASGRPVLTSNRSSMPEVAGDGALFVDPESVQDIRRGIVQLLDSPTLRQSLVEKGLHNITRFLPDNIASQYATLYQEIIEHPI